MVLYRLKKVVSENQYCLHAERTVFLLLVSLRLRSVKNIQKITKSMKMVSAAKFGKAERELRPARVYGAGASGM